MTKEIWKNKDETITVFREGTTYIFEGYAAGGDSSIPLSREELRDLFLAMKKELGLAGG